jgi:chromosome partitioning protein
MDAFTPLIVVIGGGKGGISKSTTAINLAFEWMLRGRKVLLIDADAGGTVTTTSNVASENGVEAPTVIAVGDNIRQAVPALSRTVDVTVIDTAGGISKRLAGALMIADFVLLPCPPNPPDIWRLAETVEAVKSAQELRPDLPAFVAIVRVDPRKRLSRAAHDNISACGLPLMKSKISERASVAEAPGAGMGITLYEPKSQAAAELRALLEEIEEITGRRKVSRRRTKKGAAA